MKGIVWLASYPKSGNTWVRFFLANYLRPRAEGVVPIDGMKFGQSAASRALFDEWSIVESSDLSADEVEMARADVFTAASAASQSLVFLKVHDAWSRDRSGAPLFPPGATAAAVYVVRNPLDVAVSYAHHLDEPVERTIHLMCRDDAAVNVGPGAMPLQLPQKLRSWSSHVRSWIEDSGLSPIVVRFEDLVDRPAEVFKDLLTRLGLEVDEARVAHAIQESSFERLQGQERQFGFPERWSQSTPFFRSGRVGDWTRVLSDENVRQLVDAHGTVMRTFGYLDERANPQDSAR